MAVPEQTPYIEHTGNGVTTSFALEFQCDSKDHLIVFVDGIEPPIASWSLTEGNVVFTTAPAAGKKITLQRNTPFGRTTDYQSFNNSFRPQSVNGDFDRVWWKLQELGVANWLLKQYVDKKDDELKAYLLEEIRKQGVALDQLDEYYNYLMQRLAQIAVDKGWDASFVVDGDKNQKQINSETKAEISKIYSEKLTYITPEQFGAKGDGVTDDTNAIKACIDFLLTSAEQSRKYAIRGYGDYALSSSLLVVNFGFGVDIYLRSIRAHASFPAPAAFNKGTPFFQVGKDAIGGSMVGLNIKCAYVNGDGKATWIDVSGLGAGGSHFHADKLEDVVNGVSGIKPNFHSASNKITGGYWVNGTGHGVALEKDVHVVEGWVIDVNFICEFNAGGVLLRDAQFTNIRGQADFNGRWLSELTTDSLMPSNRDKVFSNNGQTGVVVASYEHPKGVYKALVYEGQDASSLGSKFAVGAATCNGWSGSVTAIRIAGTDNFYFDVIHDFRDQPFAKCIFEMVYCGGIVGSMQYTSQISAKRTTDAYGGANNGFAVAHDGTSLNMHDAYNDSQILTTNPTFIAPNRHLYMRDFRIYGAELGVTLTQGVTTDVRTFTKENDGTVPSVCEMYKITFSSTDLGLNGEWNVFVNGANNISVKAIYEQNVNASASGGTFRLAQGALSSIFGVANIQRIF